MRSIAKQPDLVLHRVRDRHRKWLGVAEALEHRPKCRRKALRRDAEPFDGDHLGGDEAEEAPGSFGRRFGQERLGRGLEEPVLREPPARVGGLVVLGLDHGGVLVGQHRRRLECDQPGEQGQRVGDGTKIPLALRALERVPRVVNDAADRHLGQVEVAAIRSGDELLEAPVESRCVHDDRAGARFLPLHRYMVRTPGVPRSPLAPSSRSSSARVRAA